MSEDTASERTIVHLPISVEEERSRRIQEKNERNHRIAGEATRLANLSPGEWKIWFERSAERLGVEPDILAELIQARIADREQKERRAQTEARLMEDRAKRLRLSERDRQREQQRIEDIAARKAKAKAKAFTEIIKLPVDQHEAKLTELAKNLDEDITSLTAEFADYCTAEAPSTSSDVSEWSIDPWPEPVTTAQVLEELIARINLHVKAKPHEVLAIAIWVMMCWVHEVAAQYSVYLVATSPDTGHGKTTLLLV
jgi:hypothetical protein